MFRMIVVVGGAGYIGSVVVEELLKRDRRVAVIDDLSLGHQGAVPEEAVFFRADMADPAPVRQLTSEHPIRVVMHFAARALVGESVRKPRDYWSQNVSKTLRMFENWIDNGIDRFVFSSTAATYGEPESIPIDESHPTRPINPYGRTKRACEWMLEDLHEAHGVESVSLRYFNAAGAGKDVGEDHEPETHLIPNLLRAARDGEDFYLYGTNYETRDGTCLRDFVHVRDLADAHIRAMEQLDDLGCERINLGTGDGHTVREVVEVTKRVTDRDISVVEDKPRPGDPARLVASNDRARERLGWEPRRDLETIVEDAWRWEQDHPDGYS